MAPRTARPAGWFPIQAKFRCRCWTAPLRTSRAPKPSGPLDAERILAAVVPDHAPPGGGRGTVEGSGTDGRPSEGGRTRVRRPDAHLSGLRRQLHLLGRRAALLRGEGAAERAPALPELPREREACAHGRTAR